MTAASPTPPTPDAGPSPEEQRALLARPFALAHGDPLPNRLAKAALSEGLGRRDLSPGSRIRRLYERWADNGTGLIVTGNVMVDRTALGEAGNVAVEDERDLADLRAWASAAKAGGARVWVQLNHPGRQAPRTLTPRPVAPSAIAVPGTGGLFATPARSPTTRWSTWWPASRAPPASCAAPASTGCRCTPPTATSSASSSPR